MATPVGFIAEPVVALQRAIALTPTWQTATGSADINEALPTVRLHSFSIDDAESSSIHLPRPHVIVDCRKLRLRKVGCFQSQGSQLAVLFAADHAGASHDEGWITFANLIGETLREAIQDGGPEGVLAVNSVETLLSPQRSERHQRSDEYDFWEAAFTLTLDD